MTMANRLEISDEEWTAIYPILAACKHVRIASEAACRAFLAAVLWVLRSGAQWRLLPVEQGQWNSVFKRFSRWCRHGVWQALHMGCSHLPDLQNILIDSTVIRAHPYAAGAAESSAEAEALGRSRGGFGTKIHAITDARGNPLDFVLLGGQVGVDRRWQLGSLPDKLEGAGRFHQWAESGPHARSLAGATGCLDGAEARSYKPVTRIGMRCRPKLPAAAPKRPAKGVPQWAQAPVASRW